MKKIADTCDSVWSYVGCYRWNVYRKHKNVHTTHNNFVINKITYYLCHFLQGGAIYGIFRKSFAFKYLLSVSRLAFPINITRKTQAWSMFLNIIFIRWRKYTHIHAYVNYLWRDGYLPSRRAGRNSRRLFFIVSLFSPSSRQNVHLLTYRDILPPLIPLFVAVHGSLLLTDKNQWCIFAHLRTRGTSA